MRFYIDGNLYHTVNDWYTKQEGDDEKTYPAPFDQPFYLQFNLAVGGNWPGNPDETTDFENAELKVDYVKVYQLDNYDENVTKPEKEPVDLRDPDATGNYINNGDFSVNEDLTEKGIKQAEELREKIKTIDYDIIICSPLIRAKHTAKIIKVIL